MRSKTFKLSNRRQGLHWESVSGVHLVVLVSADFQGIQRSSLGADPPSDLDMDWIWVAAVTIWSGYSLSERNRLILA